MNVFARLFQRNRPKPDAAEWPAIWRKYAYTIGPAPELAETTQELIVVCAGVIDKIWNVNGGDGWNTGYEEDYIAPLREHLAADSMFSTTERERIIACLNRIAETGRRNAEVAMSDSEDEYFESDEGAAKELIGYVVRWCSNYPEPIPLGDEPEYHGHD